MRVAIIGGYGQMGSWFSVFFLKKGHQVVISGRDMKKCKAMRRKIGVEVAKSNADAVKNADLVVVSVMIDKFESVIKEISPYLNKDQRIIDITSVKEQPIKIMHKYLGGLTILGTHPMFGPNAEPKGQNFILTPTNAKERKFANEFGKFLRANGFRVKNISPRKHDEMIGVVLSLTHFIGFVTADTWRELKVDKMSALSSTSFKFLKNFVNSIVDSSPELYSYLQMNVPNVKDAESAFVKTSQKWALLAKSKRRKELIKRMSNLKSYLNKIDGV